MELGAEPYPAQQYRLMKQIAFHGQVRRANAADASVIASVLHDDFAEYRKSYTRKGFSTTALKPSDIRNRLEEGPAWVATHKGQVVGTVSVVLKPEGLYVRGMAVRPTARGLGVGRLLLEEVESFAAASGDSRLFLSTTPFLGRAIRLYQSFGFERTDCGPHDLFGTPLFTMEKLLRIGGARAPASANKGQTVPVATDLQSRNREVGKIAKETATSTSRPL